MYRLKMMVLPLVLILATAAQAADKDPYLWLEDVDGAKALKWVKERSAKDTAELEKVPEFAPIHEELLKIYNSRERIPYAGFDGAWLYNFWQDADHVRGIWRRTFLDQYVLADPAWETVLDLDALAKAEGENWVWHGADGLPPDYSRFLVTLSRGGSDAAVTREFDAITKTFVDDGFYVPEAKADVAWKDRDTVWIGTDFGPGSLTTSGYPRIVKLWTRDTPLADARTVFTGETTDVSATGYTVHTPEGDWDLVHQSPAFFRGTNYLVLGGHLVKVEIPEDAQVRGVFKNHMLLALRTDWTVGGKTYPADALLAIDVDRFLGGACDFDVLFEPQARVALDGVRSTRNHLLMTTLDNVRGRLYRLTLGKDGWSREEIPLPGIGTVGIGSTNDDNDTFFFTYTDFLTPSSLFVVREGEAPQSIKTTPAFFDTDGMTVDQREATSKDGTKIPYFIFMPKGYTANGKNPTVLYGYGGFEITMRPTYSASVGTAWVGRGGVYVLANIRGGGEFGPKWHQAAMKEKHQNAFDDFIAVAEDLIATHVTSPAHLGIEGGSNGGLLVGACFVQRPELFGAVACQVPLLDMKRYSHLLAGASWMAEYGNPDTDDWNYMKKWSPYQNLDPNKTYPKVFFYTSTRDDRVHPGHARKMVAKMTDMGKPVYYYENTEGGHSAGANLNQRAYSTALTFAYFWKMLR